MAQIASAPPRELLTKLSDLFTHGHYLTNIIASCKYYNIPSGEPSHIARARLMLHIGGITSEYVGEEKLAKCMADVSSLTRPTLFTFLDHLNKEGSKRFPHAWISCLTRPEALRQFFFRLLVEYKIAIPPLTQTTIFCGIEPPQPPSFELQGCFNHMMSAGRGRHERWVYIDKALSAFGVYPGAGLFRNIADVLVNVFTKEVLSSKYHNSLWRYIRVLRALGMLLDVDKGSDGTTVIRATLQPWNLELETPRELDFFMSLWLGTQVATARAEGRRRHEESK